MARTYIAAFLLLITLTGAFFAHRYTRSLSFSLAEEVPLSAEEARSGALDALESRYQRLSPFLSTFYVHSSIEEIGQVLEECQGCLEVEKEREDQEYHQKARLLRYLLLRLPSSDDPTWENIL